MSINDFDQFLIDNEIQEIPIFDGEIHRYKTSQSKGKSGWYFGKNIGDHKILVAGDWATDEKNYWFSKKRQTAEEKIEYSKAAAEIKAMVDSFKKNAHEKIAEKVKEYFDKIETKTISDYVLKKKIKLPIGCKVDSDGNLIVPMSDIDGRIWSIQTITKDGDKYFYPGGKVSGNMFFIKGTDKKHVMICEGIATAQSVYEAVGENVAAAFNAGNIKSVTKSFVDAGYLVILCADNDRFKEKNTGLESCIEIVKEFDPKVKMIVPNFPNTDTKSTDFNDLHATLGIEEVRKQLTPDSEIDIDGVEYLQYKHFFEKNKMLKNSKKEILSGVTFSSKTDKWSDGKWKPVMNEVGKIKSFATDYELKMDKVQAHLERWVSEKKPELLIDIPDWDGVDRISQVMSYVKMSNFEKTESTEIIKEFCANIFHRLHNPENQNRMIIFEGEQGAGKDTFIKNLFKGFGDYYCNSSVRDKEEDNYYVMDRALVINISEFDRASKMNVATLKNIITAESSFFRGAYAREASRREFRCSFVSSCNLKDVLRDSTGNRRYVFFEVEDIDWEYPKFSQSEAVQIVAQSKCLFESGFKATEKVAEKLNKDSESRTPDDPLDLALEYFDQTIAKDYLIGAKTYVTFDEISEVLTKACQVTGIGMRTLLSALKRTGRSYRGDDGNRTTRYKSFSTR